MQLVHTMLVHTMLVHAVRVCIHGVGCLLADATLLIAERTARPRAAAAAPVTDGRADANPHLPPASAPATIIPAPTAGGTAAWKEIYCLKYIAPDKFLLFKSL